VIDFKRNHATVFAVEASTVRTNPKDLPASYVSLETLQAAGK